MYIFDFEQQQAIYNTEQKNTAKIYFINYSLFLQVNIIIICIFESFFN